MHFYKVYRLGFWTLELRGFYKTTQFRRSRLSKAKEFRERGRKVTNWKTAILISMLVTVIGGLGIFVLVQAGLGDEPSWTEANCPDNASEMAQIAKGTTLAMWEKPPSDNSNVPVWNFKNLDDKGEYSQSSMQLDIPFGVFEHAYHAGPPILAEELELTHMVIASQGVWYCLKTR